MHARLLVAIAFAGAHEREGDISCPGSPATQHAWLTLTGTAFATCDVLRAEILARVDGQGSTWVDPHNTGTYTGVIHSNSGMSDVDLELAVELERLSANSQYTDRMLFTFTDGANGSCAFAGCSESQGTSFADQSTNYCNLWNLFCGAAEECCPARHSFLTNHEVVASHQAAGRSVNVCLGGSGGSGGGADGTRQTSCLATLSTTQEENGVGDDGGSGAELVGDDHSHGPDGDHAQGSEASDTQTSGEDGAGDDHSHGPDADHTHGTEASDTQTSGEAGGDDSDAGDADAGGAGDGHSHGPDADHSHGPAANGTQTVGEVSHAGRAARSAWWLSLVCFFAAGIWHS